MKKNVPAFFKEPPQAERAFLSAYEAPSLKGKFGIRIEIGPLSYIAPDTKPTTEPDILLEYLSLPSLAPAKLAHTRYTPGSDYEGSIHFLAEHHQVDLKEIRFLNASSNSILAEYDLVIHLPKPSPNEYPLTLQLKTEIQSGQPKLESPRTVEGLGELIQEKEDFWQGHAIYEGHPVEIKFHAEPAAFNEMAAFARSTLSNLKRATMNQEISRELKSLDWKLEQFKAPAAPQAEEFVPLSFYFSKRRHHPNPETIIVLAHPTVPGHWSLTFPQPDRGDLNWVPK